MSIKWKFIFPEDIRTELLEIAVNEEVYECRDTEDYPRILNYQYYLPLEKNPRDTVVNEVCSKPKDIGNIKNFSTTSDPSQWPWLALIFSRTNDTRTHVCSGSFITNRHVLTTASCVLSNNGLEIGYKITELVETDYDNTTAVYYKLKNLRIHPHYGSNLEANIAILEITDDDIETRNIDQVCIWSLPEAGELYMTDWNEEKQFQQLKFVINKTVDCLDMYPNVLANDNSPFLSEDDIFCATVIDKNTSYYNYFSKEGNGLVAYDSDNDEYYLRGMLTSFFDVYSADGFFINLEEYYTWIKHATETMY
ncbi:prostasin-like [Aphidius gifuensis]|nr:prostasin-like [Aphidius gifuensis]